MVIDRPGHLAELPALEELSVQGKEFTDASLHSLGRSKHLTSLILRANQTNLTNAGLDHLIGLKDLRRLVLEGAKITPEGKAKLIKAIPGLKIEP